MSQRGSSGQSNAPSILQLVSGKILLLLAYFFAISSLHPFLLWKRKNIAKKVIVRRLGLEVRFKHLSRPQESSAFFLTNTYRRIHIIRHSCLSYVVLTIPLSLLHVPGLFVIILPCLFLVIGRESTRMSPIR